MVACHPGRVTTQDEILADRFREAGVPVLKTSCKANRYHRLLDIVSTLIRFRKRITTQCISIYGGPSFVVEDVASRLGRWFGHRLILHLHGGALPEFFARHPGWSRRVLQRADAIVTPSPFLARTAQQLGFPALVIPNLIALEDYSHRRRSALRPRLFWMRAFHPIWNPRMALAALREVCMTHLDATLVMGGEDKGQLQEVKRLAAEWGLEARVRFAGFLNREAKAREGDAADIFLNTNQVDNTPVAIIEAWAMGLPVVSTRVGGIPDLVTHRQTGLLVEADDCVAMADAVRELLRDANLAGHLSAQGRRAAEACSWTAVRPRWEQLFSQLETAQPRSDRIRPVGAIQTPPCVE